MHASIYYRTEQKKEREMMNKMLYKHIHINCEENIDIITQSHTYTHPDIDVFLITLAKRRQ